VKLIDLPLQNSLVVNTTYDKMKNKEYYSVGTAPK